MKVLLDHRASRSVVDEENCTALHAAARCSDDQQGALVVRALCHDAPHGSRSNHNENESDDDDADDDNDFVNRKNSDGKTALHLASGAGKLRVAQVREK